MFKNLFLLGLFLLLVQLSSAAESENRVNHPITDMRAFLLRLPVPIARSIMFMAEDEGYLYPVERARARKIHITQYIGVPQWVTRMEDIAFQDLYQRASQVIEYNREPTGAPMTHRSLVVWVRERDIFWRAYQRGVLADKRDAFEQLLAKQAILQKRHGIGQRVCKGFKALFCCKKIKDKTQ